MVRLQRSKTPAESPLMRKRKNTRAGIMLKIRGFGDRHIKTLLADYDGTLSCNGEVGEKIKDRLVELARSVDIHILTGDRKAKSKACFGRLPLHIHLLSDENQDIQKRDFLKDLNTKNVAVLGNGNNDRLLLQEVKANGGLCVAVDNGEGCSIEALLNAHLLVQGAVAALDVLLKPEQFAGTLRY
jgi:soluble P-type ATPase